VAFSGGTSNDMATTHQSNIPRSPPARSHLQATTATTENGYDSDGQIGPFYDAVANEGPQEVDEPTIPQSGVAEGTGDENSGENTENSASDVGKFIDISEEKIKKMVVKDIKEELKRRGQGVAGLKVELIARLKEALEKKLPILSLEDQVNKSDEAVKGFAPEARWRLLDPIPTPVVEPTNVARMRAPTVPADDAEFVPQKFHYSEKFDRMPFVGTEKFPAVFRNQRVRKDSTGKTVFEQRVTLEGGPRTSFLEKHGLTKDSEPQDWYNAFLPIYDGSCTQSRAFTECWTHKWAQFTNKRALLLGAGQPGSMYPTFKPFTHREMEQHMALYMIQGLNPSPQVDMKLVPQSIDPIQGNDLCSSAFGPNAAVRHRQFKAFFCVQDPMKPVPSRTAYPNYKVDPLLRHMQEVSMSAWRLGRDIAGDEQTIGFQGNHRDKRRITYKNEGDGFQCDAICQKGFTWTFYFRNQPAPKRYTDQGISPLHARILAMFDQLKEKYHNCWFDNLYTSAKFARAAYLHPNKVCISGPTRISGRGLPKCVMQEEKKKPNEIRMVRGTVKAAVLDGDPSVPNLVAVSYYDQKPVHFLSTICESIRWIQCERLVYCVDTDKTEVMKFLRLNINDDYNHDMGHVDMSDQLRNYYRFDHWMRKRKWWWSLFFWAKGVLLVNAYVCYREFMKEQNLKPMKHYEFRKKVALAWLDSKQFWPTRMKNNKTAAQAQTSVQDSQRDSVPGSSNTSGHTSGKHTRSSTSSGDASSKRHRACKFTDETLDPRTGHLRDRLTVGHGKHMPEPGSDTAKCGLHSWGANQRVRAQILKCTTCGVHLCVKCYKPFHTTQEVNDLKALFPPPPACAVFIDPPLVIEEV
jgi:hypothetical protein